MRIWNSETALGLWNLSSSSFHRCLSPREGKNLIKAAWKAGIRTFDTAYSYAEASSLLFAAMREMGVHDDVNIITKVMPVPTLRRRFETELRRMGRDYTDILLIHWPSEEPQLAESLETLTALKNEGKAKEIGVANFPVNLLRWAAERFPISYHERALSLVWSKGWEEEKHLGLRTIAYSPLGMGLLSGRYQKIEEITDRRKDLPILKTAAFPQILKEIKGTPDTALSWVYGENPYGVISGFSTVSDLSILDRIAEIPEDRRKRLSALARLIDSTTDADNIFAHDWKGR